jgi:type IV secretory pathway TrbF-like protein
MAKVFAGMVLGVVVFGLLIVLAYQLRWTPEVVNCDKGRQSVTVRAAETFPEPEAGVVRRELGRCSLWFHAGD